MTMPLYAIALSLLSIAAAIRGQDDAGHALGVLASCYLLLDAWARLPKWRRGKARRSIQSPTSGGQ